MADRATDHTADLGPAWIPRENDEKPSDARPSAGHKDWREEAEWWERTCIYWHGRCDKAEAARDELVAHVETLTRTRCRGSLPEELLALYDENGLGHGLSTEKAYALFDHIEALNDDLEKAEERVRLLTEALREIEDCDPTEWHMGQGWSFAEFLQEKSRAALAAAATGDALYSWQQTADQSEAENAAWRGWSQDVERLLQAIIDRDLSIAVDGKVYRQEGYAKKLAKRLREIKALAAVAAGDADAAE